MVFAVVAMHGDEQLPIALKVCCGFGCAAVAAQMTAVVAPAPSLGGGMQRVQSPQAMPVGMETAAERFEFDVESRGHQCWDI